jgi:predicted TIM-barrel fold metal-dependent hydrolase
LDEQRERAVTLIDTDVHLRPQSTDELIEYVPATARYQRATLRAAFSRGKNVFRPFVAPFRLDALGESGAPAGSEPTLVKRQLFDEAGVDFGMMTPLAVTGANPEINALASGALNAWQAATWLAEENSRFFGAITVPIDNIPAAVREIEEWSGHPGFKQILIQNDSDRPFGHAMYDPLWAAAARHDLPVGVHFNESGRLSLGATPVGHFTQYIQQHSLARPVEYGAHLVSWICAGTFSRFPGLRVAFIEGGFLWHRALIARLNYAWEAKCATMADAAKNPLSCVRDHVRFASQPMETAPVAQDLVALMELAGADQTLMFSTDYPHFDYDDPKRALPNGLGGVMRQRIMCDNAREFYALPATRPEDQ